MRGKQFIAATVAAITLSSCATLGRGVFQEPIVNSRWEFRGCLTVGHDVYLSVYNPTIRSRDALTYYLSWREPRVGTGALTRASRAQRLDRDPYTIDSPTPYRSAARQMIQAGQPLYCRGDVTVATPLGNFTLPYVAAVSRPLASSPR